MCRIGDVDVCDPDDPAQNGKAWGWDIGVWIITSSVFVSHNGFVNDFAFRFRGDELLHEIHCPRTSKHKVVGVIENDDTPGSEVVDSLNQRGVVGGSHNRVANLHLGQHLFHESRFPDAAASGQRAGHEGGRFRLCARHQTDDLTGDFHLPGKGIFWSHDDQLYPNLLQGLARNRHLEGDRAVNLIRISLWAGAPPNRG